MAQDSPLQKPSDPNNDLAQQELATEFAHLTIKRKRYLTIFIVVLALLTFAIYNFFFVKHGNDEVAATEPAELMLAKPEVESLPDVSQIPTLPAMPSLVAPSALPQDPASSNSSSTNALPPEIVNASNSSSTPIAQNPAVATQPTAAVLPLPGPSLPTNNNLTDTGSKDQIDKKRKSSIMLVNKGSSSSTPSAAKVEQDKIFQKRADLQYLLSKGKIIEVILETAINTDHPSQISAIVARDVFAEDGATKLIPKGSKIFGSFQGKVDDVYGIIAIDWNRLDLASGYTMNISATAVDNLGRKGVRGRLDNKYKEAMTSNLVSSAINIGLAQVQDKLIRPGINTATAANNQLLLQNLNASISASSSVNKTSAPPNPAPNSIYQYCAQAAGYFTDKTMIAYTDLNTVCSSVPTAAADSDGTWSSTLTKVIAAIQNAATAVTTNNVTNSSTNLSTTQQAVQEAVKSATDKVKDILTSTKYTPNITMNQGELIRVYVNQDYVFPKQAVDGINILQ